MNGEVVKKTAPKRPNTYDNTQSIFESQASTYGPETLQITDRNQLIQGLPVLSGRNRLHI